MSNVIRRDSIGWKLDVTIKENGAVVDLSTLSQKNFIILKPDGSRLTKAAIFITNGTDGQLRYIGITGDADLLGMYELQADLIFPAGYDGPTDIGTYWVADNI